MTAKRLTRKELLKQDEFLSTTEKILKWVEDYRRELIFGAAAVVAVVLLGFVGLKYFEHRRVSAWEALEAALASYHGSVMGQSIPTETGPDAMHFVSEEEKYEQSIIALDEVIDGYGGTAPGKLSRFYRANSLMNLGRYAEAREAYTEFHDSFGRGYLSGLALLNSARSLELEGDPASAAEQYRELLEAAESYQFPKDTVLLALGDCYGVLGDDAQAIAALERVQKEFPQSVYLPQVQDKLAELGVETAPAAPAGMGANLADLMRPTE